MSVRGFLISFLFACCAWILLPGQVSGSDSGVVQALAPTTAEYSAHVVSGRTLAGALTDLTGTSISPLLGVGLQGAWTYVKTDPAKRRDLVWYYQPWCWGGMLFVVLCLAFKATIGEALPVVKKPLDAMGEAVSSGGFLIALPAIAWSFGVGASQTFGTGVVACSNFLIPQAMAAEDAAQAWPFLQSAGLAIGVIVGIILSVIIWLSWHVIDVLILLCPFPFGDALLRTARGAVLLALVAATAIHPYLGLAFALVLIFVSILAFRWSWRWIRFGWSVAWDLLLRLIGCAPDPSLPIRAFGGKGLRKSCPKRSCGRIVLGPDGGLFFVRRRWLLWSSAIPLSGRCQVRRGLLAASIVCDGEPLLQLLPSCRKRAEEAALAMGLAVESSAETPPQARRDPGRFAKASNLLEQGF